MRVVVLGAGFGGLELTTTLSEKLGDSADVVLIDQADSFVFGFSKLDVMFGRTTAESVRHAYRDVVKPGVRFVQAKIRAIDPQQRTVETDAGRFTADVLVVALGADLHPAATPGLVEAGHEFYTVAGAFATRDVLERFDGGRVVVGVTSTPFKCPPAPSETALLVHDFLTRRGLRGGQRDLTRHAAGSADPTVAGGVDRPARGVRRTQDQLAAGPPRPRPRPRTPGRAAGRRRRDPLRSVPRCSPAPCARGRARVGDVCGRLDPGRPGDTGDGVPGRVRGGRRDQRGHPEGRRLRRGPGLWWWPTRSSPGTAPPGTGHATTGSASATSSSAATRSAGSRSRSAQGSGHTAASTSRRCTTPPTRPSSARAASGAGSGASGSPTEVTRSRRCA